MNAHRFSYGVFIGQLAEGLMIMHVCDNKLCVNPYHLRQGTASQNARDAVLKGRMAFPAFTHQKGVAKPQFRGELNGRARLAAVDIPRIRKLREIGTKLAAIADRFGVSVGAVGLICRRTNWRHIA